MDFWIGNWEVFDRETKIADATVQKVLKNCALAETWTAVLHRNNDGRGLSTYNPLTKKWEYFWVADDAYTSSWTGGTMGGGGMRFDTNWPTPDGGSKLRRWSLFNLPDGRVREFCVNSVDGGKSWKTEYDLMWVKKK